MFLNSYCFLLLFFCFSQCHGNNGFCSIGKSGTYKTTLSNIVINGCWFNVCVSRPFTICLENECTTIIKHTSSNRYNLDIVDGPGIDDETIENYKKVVNNLKEYSYKNNIDIKFVLLTVYNDNDGRVFLYSNENLNTIVDYILNQFGSETQIILYDRSKTRDIKLNKCPVGDLDNKDFMKKKC